MIENLVGKSKGTEYAERQLEQAKARLAEIKRKEGAERRKAENKHKYMIVDFLIINSRPFRGGGR